VSHIWLKLKVTDALQPAEHHSHLPCSCCPCMPLQPRTRVVARPSAAFLNAEHSLLCLIINVSAGMLFSPPVHALQPRTWAVARPSAAFRMMPCDQLDITTRLQHALISICVPCSPGHGLWQDHLLPDHHPSQHSACKGPRNTIFILQDLECLLLTYSSISYMMPFTHLSCTRCLCFFPDLLSMQPRTWAVA
jgi:hypothetical protein